MATPSCVHCCDSKFFLVIEQPVPGLIVNTPTQGFNIVARSNSFRIIVKYSSKRSTNISNFHIKVIAMLESSLQVSPRSRDSKKRLCLVVPDKTARFYIRDTQEKKNQKKKSKYAFWKAFAESYCGHEDYWEDIKHQCADWWETIKKDPTHARHALYSALSDQCPRGANFDTILMSGTRCKGAEMEILQLVADYFDIRIFVLTKANSDEPYRMISRGNESVREFFLYNRQQDEWYNMTIEEHDNSDDARDYPHQVYMRDQQPLLRDQQDENILEPPLRLNHRPADEPSSTNQKALPELRAYEQYETFNDTLTRPWNKLRYVPTEDRIDPKKGRKAGPYRSLHKGEWVIEQRKKEREEERKARESVVDTTAEDTATSAAQDSTNLAHSSDGPSSTARVGGHTRLKLIGPKRPDFPLKLRLSESKVSRKRPLDLEEADEELLTQTSSRKKTRTLVATPTTATAAEIAAKNPILVLGPDPNKENHAPEARSGEPTRAEDLASQMSLTLNESARAVRAISSTGPCESTAKKLVETALAVLHLMANT